MGGGDDKGEGLKGVAESAEQGGGPGTSSAVECRIRFFLLGGGGGWG